MWQRLKWLGGQLLLLMGLYTLMRGVYLYHNWDDFRGLPSAQLRLAFLHGWRFDLSAILFVNCIFILYWFIDIPAQTWVRRLVAILFWISNFVFFAANLVDAELFQFMGKRLTMDVLHLAGDVQRQSLQLVVYYWFLTTVLIFLGWAFWRFGAKSAMNLPPLKTSWRLRTVSLVLVIPFLALGIRGGWQLKVLKPNHAYLLPRAELGVLALNTTFTMLRTKTAQALQKRHDFSDPQQLVGLLKSTPGVKAKWPEKTNVVFIILESFSLEYLGLANGQTCYAPFLCELTQRSLFFPRGFANGRRSIEAVPAILGGIPSWMDEPIIISSFQGNAVVGLGQVFKNHGYSTHFFHGAENGTMFFDSYTRRLGFENYYGLNEYPAERREADFDGSWGIFDEPYLQYVADQLDQLNGPFLAAAFTLTSHQPYKIPERYAQQFPKGTLEIHQSIGYADYALKKFFERAEKSSWFKNTLFVITADHTSKLDSEDFKTASGFYRVPLLFYHPTRELPKADTERVVQHVDIMPSLLDLLNFPAEKQNLFGRSVWSQDSSYAINRSPTGYWWMDKEFFVEWDGAQSWNFSKISGKWALQATSSGDAPESLKMVFRAAVQYYINGLLENNWYEYFKPAATPVMRSEKMAKETKASAFQSR